MDIERDLETQYDRPLAKLVFATDRNYREAIRNDGFIVRVEGVEVCRGADTFLVVDEIRSVSK